jgi:hypothetical protein
VAVRKKLKVPRSVHYETVQFTCDVMSKCDVPGPRLDIMEPTKIFWGSDHDGLVKRGRAFRASISMGTRLGTVRQSSLQLIAGKGRYPEPMPGYHGTYRSIRWLRS